MTSNSTPSLRELDALIASVGLPVRAETLEQSWARSIEVPLSPQLDDRIRRILEGQESTATEEVTILVTLRAKRERVSELEQATREFVEATGRLEGSIGSTLFRSSTEPLTLMLLERFTGREAFSRHMASDYF